MFTRQLYLYRTSTSSVNSWSGSYYPGSGKHTLTYLSIEVIIYIRLHRIAFSIPIFVA